MHISPLFEWLRGSHGPLLCFLGLILIRLIDPPLGIVLGKDLAMGALFCQFFPLY